MLEGEVVDSKGKDLQNAKVKIKIGEGLKMKEYDAMTNSKGMFEKVVGNQLKF